MKIFGFNFINELRKRMGITNAILTVKEHRKSEKVAEVNFLIDSGAEYSLAPGKILDELDIEPYKEMSFSLADGTTIKRRVCSAYFEFERDEPLLGVTTLESLGLVLNPFTRTLHPMQMLMM